MKSARGKVRQGPLEVELSDSALVADALNASVGCTSFSLEIESPLLPAVSSSKDFSGNNSSGNTSSGETPPRQKNNSKVVNLFSPNTPAEEETEESLESASTSPVESSNLPVRNYDCQNYGTCLGLAAALDWSSFSCKGCSGEVDNRLLWRAHHRVRQNKALQSLCNLPVLQND